MTQYRGTANERGYGAKWQRRRIAYLRAHPLCVYCKQTGKVSAATVVDHIVPHRGDKTLFWKESNWQSLCKTCHDGAKQSEEKNGHSVAVGLDGWPLDPAHPVNSKIRHKLTEKPS